MSTKDVGRDLETCSEKKIRFIVLQRRKRVKNGVKIKVSVTGTIIYRFLGLKNHSYHVSQPSFCRASVQCLKCKQLKQQKQPKCEKCSYKCSHKSCYVHREPRFQLSPAVYRKMAPKPELVFLTRIERCAPPQMSPQLSSQSTLQLSPKWSSQLSLQQLSQRSPKLSLQLSPQRTTQRPSQRWPSQRPPQRTPQQSLQLASQMHPQPSPQLSPKQHFASPLRGTKLNLNLYNWPLQRPPQRSPQQSQLSLQLASQIHPQPLPQLLPKQHFANPLRCTKLNNLHNANLAEVIIFSLQSRSYEKIHPTHCSKPPLFYPSTHPTKSKHESKLILKKVIVDKSPTNSSNKRTRKHRAFIDYRHIETFQE